MDWSILGGITSIVLTNLILSGDNALVIGMAARDLPAAQRRWAFLWGTILAILLRVAFTSLAAFLLGTPGLRLFGGLLLIWIAFRLLVQPPAEGEQIEVGQGLWEAVRIIVFADLIMSLDNALAIAAISGGNLLLLVFGLVISMPILIGGAALVVYFMKRLPWLIWLGGAVLAWVAGELIVEDPLIAERLDAVLPSLHLLIPLLITLGLVIAAYVWVRRRGGAPAGSER